MKTSDFEYFEFDFPVFNPAQSAVIPHIAEDTNITVTFPTATGKTAIAEAAIGYHLVSDQEGLCVYVSPFRSLSMQKHEDWKEHKSFVEYNSILCSSDNVVKPEDFIDKRLILFTLEAFDSKVRSLKHRKWLSTVKLVVIDEAHLIGQQGRGDKIEVALMRFTEINPSARIVLLSATMPNVKQLSNWLKSLNGKRSLWFSSKWRPVKTKINLHDYPDNWKDMLEDVSKVAMSGGNKVIVFVHSKKTGKEVSKAIQAKGHNCAFHHGSLTRNKRKKIEAAFNDPYSGLNILVSTSTLSSGVNMG